MADRELKQEEQKKDKKSATKRIVGIIILVDVVVAIVLLLLFGLNRCKSQDSSGSSSMPDSSYDSGELDNVFKKIVWEYLDFNGVEVPLTDLTSVIAVTYADNNSSFDLAISVKSASNRVFHYRVTNKDYSNHDNFLKYLLDSETDLFLDASATVDNYVATDESITTSKTNNKYLISESPSNIKYFSGFYFENNEYHIYQKKELVSGDPFSLEANQVIKVNNLLYGYYQRLNA